MRLLIVREIYIFYVSLINKRIVRYNIYFHFVNSHKYFFVYKFFTILLIFKYKIKFLFVQFRLLYFKEKIINFLIQVHSGCLIFL
jgi:hypothetical protein